MDLEEKFESLLLFFKNILKDPKDTAVSLYLEERSITVFTVFQKIGKVHGNWIVNGGFGRAPIRSITSKACS